MRALGNVLWHFPFFGFLTALFSFLLGSILTLLVVTAPIGLGLIQYAKFLLLPFNSVMIKKSDTDLAQNKAWKVYGFLLMVFYVPFIGLPLLLLNVIQIFCLFCTIVGIPVAIVLAKSLGTLFQPVGKICVPRAVGEIVEQRKANKEVSRYFNENNG